MKLISMIARLFILSFVGIMYFSMSSFSSQQEGHDVQDVMVDYQEVYKHKSTYKTTIKAPLEKVSEALINPEIVKQ